MNKVINHRHVAALSAFTVVFITGCAQGQRSVSNPGATNSPANQAVSKGSDSPGSKPAKGEGSGSSDKKLVDSSKVPASPDKIDLDKLSDDTTICTVGGTVITVGQYRRLFKMQQIQLQSAISRDPQTRDRVLEQARTRHIALSPAEKSELMAAARQPKSLEGKGLKEFLKEKHATEAQFDQAVLDQGLAIKTGNTMLQENLLTDMVNRVLLNQAGQEAGLMNKAMSRYIEIKHSPRYAELLKLTGFTADQLKDELLSSSMTDLMASRIEKGTSLSDAEIQSFYTKNKKLFQHKDRIKLSQIIIACPDKDQGPVKSVRTQVMQANSKLSGSQLDQAVAMAEASQERKAEEILVKVKAGADFAQTANQYTDDIPVKKSRTGGDLGWQGKDNLPPDFVKAVWPLKAGQVFPKLVRTPLGFVIIKVTGHEGPGVAALNEVKPTLKELLTRAKENQAVGQWLNNKRRTTQITLSPRFAQMLATSSTKTMR